MHNQKKRTLKQTVFSGSKFLETFSFAAEDAKDDLKNVSNMEEQKKEVTSNVWSVQ